MTRCTESSGGGGSASLLPLARAVQDCFTPRWRLLHQNKRRPRLALRTSCLPRYVAELSLRRGHCRDADPRRRRQRKTAAREFSTCASTLSNHSVPAYAPATDPRPSQCVLASHPTATVVFRPWPSYSLLCTTWHHRPTSVSRMPSSRLVSVLVPVSSRARFSSAVSCG